MSFSNTLVGNNYRPDRKILEALTALTQRVEALEVEKVSLRAENVELLSKARGALRVGKDPCPIRR